MEKNIFKNAKFGDKFYTRDGRVAVLVSKNGIYPVNNALVIEGCFVWQEYSDEGYRIITYDKDSNIIKDDNDDIISKYQEPINEEKLEMLAISECGKMLEPIDVNGYDYVSLGDAEDCFIAGYKKAKEE